MKEGKYQVLFFKKILYCLLYKGNIYINNELIDIQNIQKIMKKCAGYVTQEDYLLPHLTVKGFFIIHEKFPIYIKKL